jgi:hypothetical protein
LGFGFARSILLSELLNQRLSLLLAESIAEFVELLAIGLLAVVCR